MQRKPFTEEQNMFREAFRAFLHKEVVPHQERWLEAGIVDREVFRKAGENGFLLCWADERDGGLGLRDFRYEQIMIEELALIGETGFAMNLHNRIVGPYIDRFGSDEQKQRFLPGCISGETILGVAMTEPDAGSDLAGMRATAQDRGDHFILNGSKTYITNGMLGDLFVVAAKSDPSNPRAIGLFLVERGMEGFSRGRKLKKMGQRSQDTAELFFENVVVPRANVLGDETRGFHYLMQGLAEERLQAGTRCVAAAQYAFGLTLDFIRERKVFGQALSQYQNTRFEMAQMSTEIDLAQVYVDRCVEEHNAGRLTPEDAARLKLFASELQGRVVDKGVQFHGGAGYMDEYPISRAYTDARVTRIFAGSSEIMKEIIARSLDLK
ncbi:acyl-CoA dehydrogenase family protein [Marinobacterium rhizophilum]|uniref:Acyl-CoA dehydrogenase family protein n=1 Tax=Marinobacterium rhizophilum TaxID=420402 RepID=A0ABY5HJF0_9GAMM|nr:acyl-CoA dehydrogenase family protein [Marinobacterium rhizophilum]UTW12413.1 acyl-CoA dehydrogenase family protein [Marinobacterium rhizophilum]